MSDKAYLAALERVQELKAQRDKLREALEEIENARCDFQDLPGIARAALAETEEGE